MTDIEDALSSIVSLCENPHWNTDHKQRIWELAQRQLNKIRRCGNAHETIQLHSSKSLDVKIIYPDRHVTIGIDVKPDLWKIICSQVQLDGLIIADTIYQESLEDGSWEPSCPFLE
jgi:hypothetical protein